MLWWTGASALRYGKAVMPFLPRSPPRRSHSSGVCMASRQELDSSSPKALLCIHFCSPAQQTSISLRCIPRNRIGSKHHHVVDADDPCAPRQRHVAMDAPSRFPAGRPDAGAAADALIAQPVSP